MQREHRFDVLRDTIGSAQGRGRQQASHGAFLRTQAVQLMLRICIASLSCTPKPQYCQRRYPSQADTLRE